MISQVDPRQGAEIENARRRIMRAAFKLFAENGYAGTSTLAIATKARVSKRDLYALFPTKQDALIACMSSRSAKMRLPSDWPAPNNRKALVSALTSLSTRLLTETCDPDVVAMFRLAISEAERSPEIAMALEDCRATNARTVAELFAGAQARGLLMSRPADESAEIFLKMLLGDVLLGLLLAVRPRPSRQQMRQYAAEVTRTYLSGHQACANRSVTGARSASVFLKRTGGHFA
jgi:AcrR family transcriptional regulator